MRCCTTMLSTIASTLKMQIRTVQRLKAQLNASDDPLQVVEQKPKAEDSARKTRTKRFIEKVQAIIDETPHRCVAIGWPVADSGCGSRTRRQAHKSKETQATTLYPSLTGPFLPRPETAGLLRLVIPREITNMTSHNTKASLIAAICRGMLPVLDPYGGGD